MNFKASTVGKKEMDQQENSGNVPDEDGVE